MSFRLRTHRSTQLRTPACPDVTTWKRLMHSDWHAAAAAERDG